MATVVVSVQQLDDLPMICAKTGLRRNITKQTGVAYRPRLLAWPIMEMFGPSPFTYFMLSQVRSFGLPLSRSAVLRQRMYRYPTRLLGLGTLLMLVLSVLANASLLLLVAGCLLVALAVNLLVERLLTQVRCLLDPSGLTVRISRCSPEFAEAAKRLEPGVS